MALSREATRRDHRSKWLWAKTDGHCAYCGVAFGSPADMTTDHLHPRARGGSNARDNRYPCCRGCNATKGKRPLNYLREVLQRRLWGRPAFTAEQLSYLDSCGFVFPPEQPYQFYWEKLGNTFHEEGA